jgi:hypothetical protein
LWGAVLCWCPASRFVLASRHARVLGPAFASCLDCRRARPHSGPGLCIAFFCGCCALRVHAFSRAWRWLWRLLFRVVRRTVGARCPTRPLPLARSLSAVGGLGGWGGCVACCAVGAWFVVQLLL